MYTDPTPEDDIEIVPRAVAAETLRRKAPSLRPDVNIMEAAARGQAEAVAVREAWRFKHPVRIVSPAEFEEMVERNPVTFHG